jgi:hypothetical protein
MLKRYTQVTFIAVFAVCILNFANAQDSKGDYRETVIHIPGLDSDKTYQAIEQLYKNTSGVEIMLRCKRGEMLVLKTDTRIHPDMDKLLKRIADSNFKAAVLDGFDYNKAVATCSDFKPE